MKPILVWLFLGGLCLANTSIVAIDPTQMQAKITVRTEATLFARRLIPFRAGMKRPKVPPLAKEERKAPTWAIRS